MKPRLTKFDILLKKAEMYDHKVPRFADERLERKMDSDAVSEKVQRLLKKKGYPVTLEDSTIAIYQLIQKGGALKNIDPSYYVLVGPVITGTENPAYLTVAMLKDAFKKCGLDGKIRQFARKHASEIAKISEVLNRPGLLTTSLWELPLDEAQTFPWKSIAWMSDFQSSNPDCPVDVKVLLSKLAERKREMQILESKKTNIAKSTFKAKKKTAPKKKKSGK